VVYPPPWHSLCNSKDQDILIEQSDTQIEKVNCTTNNASVFALLGDGKQVIYFKSSEKVAPKQNSKHCEPC